MESRVLPRPGEPGAAAAVMPYGWRPPQAKPKKRGISVGRIVSVLLLLFLIGVLALAALPLGMG